MSTTALPRRRTPATVRLPQGALLVGGATKLYGAALRGVTPHPDLLPKVLAIDAGAAPSAALTGLLIVLGVAVVPVLPSMAP